MAAATLRDRAQSAAQLRRPSFDAVTRRVVMPRNVTVELVRFVLCCIIPLSESLDLPFDLGMTCFVLHAFRCSYLFRGSQLFELFMGMNDAVRRDFDNVAGMTLTRSLLVDSDELGESGCRCGLQQGSLRRGA